MFNKTILKFSGAFLVLSVFNAFVIFYWLQRCHQTGSSFYCDSFAFGGPYLILGIPALVLLGLSIILLITSRFYKKDVGAVFRTVFVILGLIIFALPYLPVFLPSSQPKTYSDFNARMEQGRIQTEQNKLEACAQYKITMSQWKEGQPMPVPPSRDCN